MTNALILNDILIDGANGFTSQIDVLLIANTGLYVLEVKTYIAAKIYGDGTQNHWSYYLHRKKRRRNRSYTASLFGDIKLYGVNYLT